METAQKIIKARAKDYALEDIALTQVYAGVNKQASEATELIDDARTKLRILNRLALALATESVSDFEQYLDGRRLKTAFTLSERQLAKQLAEAILGNRLGSD